MAINFSQKQQDIVIALKQELFFSPKCFLMHVARRFMAGWMTTQLICWFWLGLSLLAQLVFNPEQFARDFASLEKIHHAAYLAAETINSSCGIYGVLGGFIFVAVLTWAQAAERAGYTQRRGG